MICGHEKSFHTYEPPISSVSMTSESSTFSSESGNVAIPFSREVIGSTNGAFRSNVSGVYYVFGESACMGSRIMHGLLIDVHDLNRSRKSI